MPDAGSGQETIAKWFTRTRGRQPVSMSEAQAEWLKEFHALNPAQADLRARTRRYAEEKGGIVASFLEMRHSEAWGRIGGATLEAAARSLGAEKESLRNIEHQFFEEVLVPWLSTYPKSNRGPLNYPR